MPIVRISLHKVNAERNPEAKVGKVNINNNVSVDDLQKMDFSVEGKQGVKFNFAFKCNYEPELGKIEVAGQVVYVGQEAEVSKLMEEWDKAKRIPATVMEQVVNAALHKGNVQAIKISEDVNLPSPLPLPKVKQNLQQAAPADTLAKKA